MPAHIVQPGAGMLAETVQGLERDGEEVIQVVGSDSLWVVITRKVMPKVGVIEYRTNAAKGETSGRPRPARTAS